MTTVEEFRWRFYDDALGHQWSHWHSVALPCATCCCGGPDEGEHQEGAEYYVTEFGDELGLERGHTRYDPVDPDFEREVEWR